MTSAQATPRLAVAPYVFFPAAASTSLIVVATILAPELAERIFGGVTTWIVGHLGWLFTLVVTACLLVVAWLPWGARGRVRLGRPDEKPGFSRLSWFSMLFSAGMGIGLVFFGVAEPMAHFENPPIGDLETAHTARRAMGITFFHWGLHAWAIYVLLGLALAYFSHARGLPLAVRSALYPILGERIHGRLGDLTDLLAVFGTIFGLATSLGLGAKQIASGLELLMGWKSGLGLQIGVIAAVTGAATVSLVSGVNRGIRRLSELTLILAGLLLLFVAIMGPRGADSLLIFRDLAAYGRQAVAALTFSSEAGSNEWQSAWTIFYWAWWIAWAPFVSTFIARISRGRTVREFVLGVLLLPTGLTIAWLFVFGETALYLEHHRGGVISEGMDGDVALSLYALLAQLPLSTWTSFVGALIVALFFVTSSDSGSFVVDILTSGGKPNPPVWQRVFWALTEGSVAAALLWGGGLRALQSAAIATGLPFAIVLLLVGYGLVRTLTDPGVISRPPPAEPEESKSPPMPA